jgi:hypothetical protein
MSLIQSRGLLVHHGLHIKTYVLAYDFEKLYGTTEQALAEVSHALPDNAQALNTEHGHKYRYGVAFAGGIQGHRERYREIGVYLFDFDSPHRQTNPRFDVFGFEFDNGIYKPRVKAGTETEAIVLGREAELRRALADVNSATPVNFYLFPDIWPVFEGALQPIDLEVSYIKVK